MENPRARGRSHFFKDWKILASLAGLALTLAQSTDAQSWGRLVTNWFSMTNPCVYSVYRSNFVYGAPVYITDIRTNGQYKPYENFNSRSLDVYRAHDGANFFSNCPVVFFVHGGAWTDGYRDWYDFVAQPFTGNKGWITVVVDYRLTTTNALLAQPGCLARVDCTNRVRAAWYPDNIQDLTNAFRWVVDHIGEQGGDTNKIVVFGHSAGGQLVSLLATHTNFASLRPRIRGVVSMSGAYNLDEMATWFWSGTFNEVFANGSGTGELAEASAATYVQPGVSLPPFYLLRAGSNELVSLTEQFSMFSARLNYAGVAVTSDVLTNYTHYTEMEQFGDTNSQPTRRVVSFIENLLAGDQPPALQVYWGDIHSHSSYSDDSMLWFGNAGNPPEDALDYARTNSRLDFMAMTDHAEMLTTNRPVFPHVNEWQKLQDACNSKNDPTNFVAFIGFEYTFSGSEPGYGHKCVIFEGTNVPANPLGAPVDFHAANSAIACTNPIQLWQHLAPYKCVTIPHHPAKGLSSHDTNSMINMSTDWRRDNVNAKIQPAVEVYSVHGSSESAGDTEKVYEFRAEKSVEAALLKWTEADHDPGYQLGIVASTDNHLSRPGSVDELPENVSEREGPYTGGLIAALATNRTRGAIFAAITNRRVYATSGARIRLHFSADYGYSTIPMGGTAHVIEPATSIVLHVLAQGATAGITNIQIVRNGAIVCDRIYSGMTTADTVALEYTDTNVLAWTYYRAKIRQSPTPRVLADGDTNTPVTMTTACERAWSSPLWIEGDRTSPLTVYVDSGATGRNTGIAWTDAMTNLVNALDAAHNSDEVWVAAGTYRPLCAGETNRLEGFVLRPGARLYGGFAGGETARAARKPAKNVAVLSGDTGAAGDSSDNAYHVLSAAGGGLLCGVTLAAGRADGTNTLQMSGGGLLNTGGPLSIAECVFVGNRAVEGGAVHNDNGALTMVNCLLYSNAAAEAGGAVNNYESDLWMTNCTIADNRVTNTVVRGGGGIHDSSSSSLQLRNVVLWNNQANNGNGSQLMVSRTSAAVLASCVIQGGLAGVHTNFSGSVQDAGFNSTNDPAFVAAGDYRVAATSSCIDSSTNGSDNDLDGLPRPLDGNADGTNRWDIGAYEFVNPLADSDGDWLTDTDEVAAGTGLLIPDTDGDRMGDGAETRAGTDPLDAASFLSLEVRCLGDLDRNCCPVVRRVGTILSPEPIHESARRRFLDRHTVEHSRRLSRRERGNRRHRDRNRPVVLPARRRMIFDIAG